MSGTEEFGSGGYGTGDAERAAAESGPGGSARNAPPTGPRVHVPGAVPPPNQGAGPAVGGANGAPWLAAGSVPYAEAMFGGAGQDGPQGPGGSGEHGMPAGQGQRIGGGRRGVPETAVPGYPEGYAPQGYTNGYAQRPGPQQAPAMPQQHAPRQQMPQQQNYDPAAYEYEITERQPRLDEPPHGGYGQPAPDRPGPGFEPRPGFEQRPFQTGPYTGGPAFDEPTTEFRPGPLFDEPTVRPASPPPGPPIPPPGAVVAGNGLNGRSAAYGPRQVPQGPGTGPAPVNGARQQQPMPSAAQQRPPMSDAGAWTAAPAPAMGQPAAQQQPAQQQRLQQPAPHPAAPQQAPQQHSATGPSGAGVTTSGHPGAGQPGQGAGVRNLSASSSGIPRVPSQQAAEAVAAQAAATSVGVAAPTPTRPPLPDEPPPGPSPLPVRPPRAERQAQQVQAQPPQTPAVQPQPMQPPAAPSQVASAAQPAAAPAPPVQAQTQTPGPAMAAVRETLTPPRRAPQPQPSQQAPAPSPSVPQQAGQSQHVQGQNVQDHADDDLTSERLRSVAPSVPAPRAAAPEPQPARVAAAQAPAQAVAAAVSAPAQPAAVQRLGRSGSFDALAEPELDEDDGEDSDELIVPWQAAAAPSVTVPSVTAAAPAQPPAPVASDDASQQQPVQPARPIAHQSVPPVQPQAVHQEPAPATPQQPQNEPIVEHAPATTATQGPQTHSVAPTRAEATVPRPQVQAQIQAPAPVQDQPQPQAQVQAEAPAAPAAAAPAVQPPAQPAVPEAEPASAPANTSGPNVPAPRGTRRRLPEPPATSAAAQTTAPVADPGAEPDPRSYAQSAPAPAAAMAVVATAGPVVIPDDDLDPDFDDGMRAPAYDDEALAAVYRVIHERRDVRNDFLPDEMPTEVLTRILEAAHTAPSVGFSQPWDFLVIRDQAMRQRVHELAVRQRRAYAASLPKARARAFAALKVEAILDTPVNIVVTCDPTRGGRHTLGRYTQPMMAPFSSCLAVENLWLAARAEGLGVGWVSFFDERELAAVLDLPDHLQVVAYLCVGYVKAFPHEPELAGAGWAQRRPLAWAVHEERFGHRALPGAQPISLLSETVDAVRGLDPQALSEARDRQARMTKPPGSLGALEALSEQLAGLAGVCPPPLPEPAALAVFAADHGVHAQGVTPWPQEVTAQMVANFLAGGAVVNAFAKQVGAEVCVVDVGVAADLATQTGLIPRKIRYGTADMTQGPALTREEVTAAIEAGIETARDLVAAGNRCLLTGDMGIANTTASAALIAAFTGASPAQVTGYGTGIDEQTYAHKVEVVGAALELHRPDPADPVGVLAAFGGLEHAALAGFILGAAALRIPVVLDGVIAGAAALVAQALSPEVTAACVAGHRSAEPGHALALEALGITPLIDLELRLGEGSGAALALPLVGAAVRALREVATFDDAGVSDASSATVAPPTERERT